NVSLIEAVKLFKKLEQPFKLDLLADLKKYGTTNSEEILAIKQKTKKALKAPTTVSLYELRTFTDLCRGPHLKSTGVASLPFKLLKVSGAYWRGEEKEAMLTRIYGVAFKTKKELDDYLNLLAEAEKRDHRKLGRELELFVFDETAPGMPYWLPKGLIIYNTLLDFWRKEHGKRGYQEIKSPLINKKSLYETSGHWDHYRENMFISETEEGETYCLKPMNCPNAMVVFKMHPRSYKELPLRLSDSDTLHRFEKSGTLNGLLRAREFSQDDAHIFVTEDQIESEYKNLFEIVERFYSIFHLNYSFRLGTRPENFMGDIKTWDKAEQTLNHLLKNSGKTYTIKNGDGAFYGPKIDILMKDSLGREWQMGTMQLDFQLPRNFDLKYTDNKGKEQTPVVIHRVIYGSLERFIGILTENYAGAFPLWISPMQVVIIPISEKQSDWSGEVKNSLEELEIRVSEIEANEPLGARVRQGVLPLEAFLAKIKAEIQNKA
ncbi:MAG: threonine--tRNA ligase, partial [Candidatus Parcubacteria bacterium]|nr:threonine--tRNA ligase [Candidatus Parcubacteria bacterium]